MKRNKPCNSRKNKFSRPHLGAYELEPFENIIQHPFVGIDVKGGDYPSECVGSFILPDVDIRARIPENVAVFVQPVVSEP